MKIFAKALDILFLFLLSAFLLGGLLAAVLRPKDINWYENRPANRLHRPTLEAFLDGSFQTSVEDGLGDQVLMAQTFKKAYNDGTSNLLFGVLRGFLDSRPQRYVYLREVNTFGGDQLVYGPKPLENISQALTARAQGLNALMEAHPELDFYVYYIEKDTDMNFETGEKTGAYEFLESRLSLPEGHVACFEIDGFDTFYDLFFRTDHHWNYKGSYKAYGEAAALLGVEEPLIEPIEEVDLPYTFSGSKAKEAGAAEVFTEGFTVYRFDYPEMEISINGQPQEDYGQAGACLAGEAEKIDYGVYYGSDPGEAAFDTGREGRPNLLLMGESYDNAILKLLASHFHKTYAVDMRYYEGEVGPFSFSRYVEEKGIDKVLFIGNMDYFVMDEFLPEE